MSRPSSFALRGRRALVAIKDERDLSILRRQLDRLGIIMTQWDMAAHPSPDQNADVVILEDDVIPATTEASSACSHIPIIVLVGTETPSRLKAILNLEPASFLIKPLRSAGLYTALVVAFDRAQKTHDTQHRIAKLEERIRSRRLVLTAVLQIMACRDIREPEAFALIRRAAMEQRKTVEQVSAEIAATGGVAFRDARTA